MKRFKLSLIASALLIAVVAFAANIKDNTLNLGDGNPATDKDLNMGAGVVKWDAASQKLRFANDGGTVFNDIGGGGSGGSAGVNILSNGDIETGSLNGWTNSGGGTLVTTSATSEVAFGGFALSYDAAGSSDAVVSDQVTIPSGLQGANCLGRIYYKGGDSTLSLEVIDGSSNVLASQTLSVAASYRTESVSFVCPGSGTIALRVIASGTSNIVFLDNLHLGENFLVGSVSQAELMAYAYYPVTGSCAWTQTSATFVDFPVDTDCPAITVGHSSPNVSIDVADNDLPDLKFDSDLPPGRYHATVTLRGSSGTAAASAGFRLVAMPANINGQPCGFSQDPTTSSVTQTCHITFDSSVSSVDELKVQGSASSGTVVIQNELINSEMTFVVERYPTVPQSALRPEQVSWHVNANQGGANPSLGTVTVADTEITDGGLDTVTNAGSIAAFQACVDGEAAAGTTCSGNESIGIAFDAPVSGDILVCASYSWESEVSNGQVRNAFEIKKVDNTSGAISARGNSKLSGYIEDNTGINSNALPYRVCGNFKLSASGRHTFKLYHDQSASGTVNSSVILADRDAVSLERDIHWEVYPISTGLPQPQILNHVSTKADTGVSIASAKVTCSGSSSIDSEDGSWLASVGNIASGDCTLTFDAGAFVNAPKCFATADSSGPALSLGATSESTSSVSISCVVSNTAADCTSFIANVMCLGVK